MPGSEAEVAIETPETKESVVTKTEQSVAEKENNVVNNTENDTDDGGENNMEETEKETTNTNGSIESSESNTDVEITTEKRSAEDQGNEQEESPVKRLKTDSEDADLSNGAVETEEPAETA